MQYGDVHRSVVQHGAEQYGAVHCGTLPHNVEWRRTIWCSSVRLPPPHVYQAPSTYEPSTKTSNETPSHFWRGAPTAPLTLPPGHLRARPSHSATGAAAAIGMGACHCHPTPQHAPEGRNLTCSDWGCPTTRRLPRVGRASPSCMASRGCGNERLLLCPDT